MSRAVIARSTGDRQPGVNEALRESEWKCGNLPLRAIMLSCKFEIHGHLIETCRTANGGEFVLVNGRRVSNKSMAGWYRASHFVEIKDADGVEHAIEVRWSHKAKSGWWGPLGVIVSIDGHERYRLAAIERDSLRKSKCRSCKYDLKGQQPSDGFVTCPECGVVDSVHHLDFGDDDPTTGVT